MEFPLLTLEAQIESAEAVFDIAESQFFSQVGAQIQTAEAVADNTEARVVSETDFWISQQSPAGIVEEFDNPVQLLSDAVEILDDTELGLHTPRFNGEDGTDRARILCRLTRLEGLIVWAVLRLIAAMLGINQRVVDIILEVMGGRMTVIEGMIQTTILLLEDDIRDVLKRLDGLAGEIVDAVVDDVLDAIEDAVLSSSEVEAIVRNQATRIIDAVENSEDSVIDAISDQTRTLLDSAGETLRRIADEARRIIAEVILTGERVVDEVDRNVDRSLSIQLGPVNATLDRIETTAFGISAPLEGIGDILQFISKSDLIDLPGTFAEKFARGFDKGLDRILGDVSGKLSSFLERALIQLGIDPVGARRLSSAFDAGDPGSQLLTIGAFVMVIGFALPIIAGQALGPFIEQIVQEFSRIAKQSLLDPASIQELRNRREISDARARDELAQQGFSEARQDGLISLRQQLLGVNEILQLWLRGDLTTPETELRLGDLGFRSKQRIELRKLALLLVPVQDLVLMAVREVFTPDVRRRFQLDLDFPPEFAERAIQLGLSEKIAKEYWAAHWALPSPQQGFQMFQRRIIEQSDLELLLRSLDVMPFWRERMIKLSFRPLTRVDLRRMWDLGLITEEAELQERFQDLGFSPDDSAFQVEFVKQFTGVGDPDIEAATGLTRATVIGFYRDGTITRDQAASLMDTLGVSDSAADLFLLNEDMDRERDERKAEVSLILAQASAGVITFEQAIDKLNALGLESTELGRALTSLRRKEASATTLPSVEQLGKMFSSDIIDETTTTSALRSRGFSTEWAGRLVELFQEE